MDVNYIQIYVGKYSFSLKFIKKYILNYSPTEDHFSKKLDATESFKCLAQRLIKHALHHRNRFLWAKSPSFGKELLDDVGRIPPPLL